MRKIFQIDGAKRVKVIILMTENKEIDEKHWLKAGALSEAFDFLNNPEEDIYSLEDGYSFNEER